MKNILNIALLPMEIAWGDKKENISRLQNAVNHLPDNIDLLVLPETFSTGFPSGKSKEYVMEKAESDNGATLTYLKQLAAVRNIAIAGSFIAYYNTELFNRAFFIEPNGETHLADKRHLFSMAGEDKIFRPGTKRLSVRFRGWNITMSVCYDIRFPVWCRNVGNKYDLMIFVANWPKVRVDAWNKLLFARAIENESYVCGVDCSGTDDNGIFYDGSSKAIDFKGQEIGERKGEFIVASLDMEKLRVFREKFPAWKDADTFHIDEI